jgi:predicted esterase
MNSTELTYRHVFQRAASDDAWTLLLLHGTGGSERDLLPLGSALGQLSGREFHILSPRGDVLERGMPRFFRRFAEGKFDEDDIRYRAARLGEFVLSAAERYRFRPDRVIAAGFSNGANIAASLLLLRPEILKAAALFSPMTPLLPASAPDLADVDVLIAAGRLDPMAPPEETTRLADLLRAYGADVNVHWSQAGHTITREAVTAAGGWLKDIADG